MAVVDFLYHENSPTWVGDEPATLGTEGPRQTNYATQTGSCEDMNVRKGSRKKCGLRVSQRTQTTAEEFHWTGREMPPAACQEKAARIYAFIRSFLCSFAVNGISLSGLV
ncbi:hypothetical protein TNCV_4383641 [Trichonephila clavipes]|nr:hypothetical protein TNCV_4383641 [Trichonephila clavipes]